MQPSKICIDFIAHEEGEVLHPYLDQAGVPTIGIGSTMYKNGQKVSMHDPHITHDQAIDLLMWEVDNKAKSVNAFIAVAGVIINQNQFDALVSFAYNEGVGALQGSTLLKKVKANPANLSIRDEFLKWDKITVSGKKVFDDGLLARRKREADLYFKPIS
jgi:lysozyme